jgi:hypothetical protein
MPPSPGPSLCIFADFTSHLVLTVTQAEKKQKAGSEKQKDMYPKYKNIIEIHSWGPCIGSANHGIYSPLTVWHVLGTPKPHGIHIHAWLVGP